VYLEGANALELYYQALEEYNEKQKKANKTTEATIKLNETIINQELSVGDKAAKKA
jgi:hypothetical protein